MKYNFDQTLDIDRSIFVRYNPIYLKSIFKNQQALPFWVADSDFQVMPELIEALEKTAQRGVFGYEYKSPKLKDALAGWFSQRHGLSMATRNIMFTTSVLTSITAIIDELTNEGDGVIIQPPVYQAFESMITSLNRKMINNPLLLKNDKYIIDFDDLEQKAALAESKMMILCSPHNPVGRVWTQQELARIAQICIKYKVLMITDEIHADIIYPGHKFIGMTSVYDSQSDQIIMVGSAGKSFGIPGLVDSFIYTPNKELKATIQGRIMKYHLGKSNAFANTAMETVYAKGDAWIDAFTIYLKGNVDYIKGFIKEELPQLKLIEPEGTYQVWLNFNQFGLDEGVLMKKLGHEAGVALNNGSSYGEGGNNFCRMNIACPRSVIGQALNRIKDALGGIEV